MTRSCSFCITLHRVPQATVTVCGCDSLVHGGDRHPGGGPVWPHWRRRPRCADPVVRHRTGSLRLEKLFHPKIRGWRCACLSSCFRMQHLLENSPGFKTFGHCGMGSRMMCWSGTLKCADTYSSCMHANMGWRIVVLEAHVDCQGRHGSGREARTRAWCWPGHAVAQTCVGDPVGTTRARTRTLRRCRRCSSCRCSCLHGWSSAGGRT